MPTCIKTGAVLDASGNIHDINMAKSLYGDVHVVGGCCIVHFPQIKTPEDVVRWDMSKKHGSIKLIGDYWLRMDYMPYNILVIPARRIEFYSSMLHPVDKVAFDNAVYLSEYAP